MNAAKLPPLANRALLIAAPIAAIALARAMTYTDWAVANTTIAALLFAWIVTDALCLTAIAKAPRFRPGLLAMLGAGSLASMVVILGASSPVRERIFDMPALLGAAAMTAALWLTVASHRVITAGGQNGDWETALSQVLPGSFLRFLLRELRMMHLALFRWGAKPDIPSGSTAFAYHRYLTPMLITLGVLQIVELAVVHLLLMLWSEMIAWIVFALTLAGLLWFTAFTKSLRLMPIILAHDHIHVRAGILADFRVPFAAVAAIEDRIDAQALEAKSTFNGAILSSPNVALRLSTPVDVPGPFGRARQIDFVALRLDDPASFREALARAI